MKLRNPKPNTAFYELNGRLALFQQGPVQSEYWRKYWKDGSTQAILQQGRAGEIPELEDVIERWAPRNRPVLEAGCGPGHFVAALKQRGYDAIGIELEAEVVEQVRASHPDLDVRVGDVRKLEFADQSIGCYLSLGVVEHFVEGPLAVLREARRVLAADGIALVSVPYLNPLRRGHLDASSSSETRTGGFHQYYFGVEEFSRLAAEVGFEVIDSLPYAVEAFVIREHPIFSRVWKSRFLRERMRVHVRRAFRASPRWARDRYSHMIMFVCRPVAS